MDINQLKTFITVAKTSSLTQAAKILCLSQPAISAHIKSLETEFNIKLFNRTSKGMQITDDGLSIKEDALIVLNAVNKFRNKALALNSNYSCKLGVIYDSSILHLPNVLSQLQHKYKNISLIVEQNISGYIIDDILNGEIDAGFIIGEVNEIKLGKMPLFPIVLCIVGPWIWRDKLNKAELETLQNFPWISTTEKCSFTKITRIFLGKYGISVDNINVVTDHDKTLADLVAMGAGITLMREDIALALQDKKEVYIWSKEKITSQVYFVWDIDKENTPIISDLINIIKRIWNI